MKIPIHYKDIFMEVPTSIIKISALEITEALNEHGTAIVDFLTEDTDQYEIINNLTSQTEVKLAFMPENEPQVIFIGFPTKVRAKAIKNIYHIALELKSKSFLLDIKKKRRSFQNKDNPYENLFKQIMSDYKGNIFDAASNGALQQESIIQYDESD